MYTRASGPVRRPLAPNRRLGAVTRWSCQPSATSTECMPEFSAYRDDCAAMVMVLPRSFPYTVWAGRYQLSVVQTIAPNLAPLTLTAKSTDGNSVLQWTERNMLSRQKRAVDAVADVGRVRGRRKQVMEDFLRLDGRTVVVSGAGGGGIG